MVCAEDAEEKLGTTKEEKLTKLKVVINTNKTKQC